MPRKKIREHVLRYNLQVLTILHIYKELKWATVAQSVQRLATAWVIRGWIRAEGLWSTQPPVKSAPSLFPGVKRPGRGLDHPFPSSTEVKDKVELYIYFPSRPSWHVLDGTLTIYFIQNLIEECPCITTMFTRSCWSQKTSQPLELSMIFIRNSPKHSL